MNHEEDLNQSLAAMRSALREIANRAECLYWDYPDDRPSPCDCQTCVAKAALLEDKKQDWRYRGARAYRAESGHNPREARIVRSFREHVDDSLLSKVLSNEDKTLLRGSIETITSQPTPRDWFVASSVVQWLATNVGMQVLIDAGWKYTLWEEDRKEREGG